MTVRAFASEVSRKERKRMPAKNAKHGFFFAPFADLLSVLSEKLPHLRPIHN